MKVYKRGIHDQYGNCLEGITGNYQKYFTRSSPGIFQTDGAQMYVLVEPEREEDARFTHPQLGPVELWNTHCTGELRWEEPFGSSVEHMSSDCFLAVKHFGLRPTRMDEEEWRDLLEGQLIRREDLSEVEIKVLEKAVREGTARVISQERIKDLEGEWHNTIRYPPEHNALYDLERKGLIAIGGSSSGTGFGEEAHIWRSKSFYKITSRGLKVLQGDKA